MHSLYMLRMEQLTKP